MVVYRFTLQLTNSLPGGDNLSMIVSALLEHISNPDHSAVCYTELINGGLSVYFAADQLASRGRQPQYDSERVAGTHQ